MTDDRAARLAEIDARLAKDETQTQHDWHWGGKIVPDVRFLRAEVARLEQALGQERAALYTTVDAAYPRTPAEAEAAALRARVTAVEQVLEQHGVDYGDPAAAVAGLFVMIDDWQTQHVAAEARVAALTAALEQFVESFDGQTEPMPPIAWCVALVVGKAALADLPAPTTP